MKPPYTSRQGKFLASMKMRKRMHEDPLVAEIQYELMPGRYVRWDEVSRLVHNLDRVHEKVEGLVTVGEAAGMGGKGNCPEISAELAQ